MIPGLCSRAHSRAGLVVPGQPAGNGLGLLPQRPHLAEQIRPWADLFL